MTRKTGTIGRPPAPVVLIAGAAGWLALAGCASNATTTAAPRPAAAPAPDYARPLGPGESALRLVTDPARLPDMKPAYDESDMMLVEAVDESLRWFDAPSSRQWFPFEQVSHEQARASLVAFRALAEASPDGYAFEREFRRMFNVYESVGYNGQGVVLYTGYFAPVLSASRTRNATHRVPIYRRPADLVTDPITGEPQGRRTASGTVVPYYTRKEIEDRKLLAGTEIFWLEDELSAYIVHVNGSAKLRLTDDSTVFVGYAGKTDHAYQGLGQSLIDSEVMTKEDLSLAGIRRLYRQKPDLINHLIMKNENYVFFTEYDGSKWPAGSLGVRVTAESSLATDKKIYPRGGLVMVDTRTATFSGGPRRFQRFMLDQDTGGAIKAPGRADIFMGVGSSAEILAGGQYAEGRLFYFFLKPEYVAEFTAGSGNLAAGQR